MCSGGMCAVGVAGGFASGVDALVFAALPVMAAGMGAMGGAMYKVAQTTMFVAAEILSLGDADVPAILWQGGRELVPAMATGAVIGLSALGLMFLAGCWDNEKQKEK